MKFAQRALGIVAVILLTGCASDSPTTGSTTPAPTTTATIVTDEAVTEPSATAPVSTADFLLGGEIVGNTYGPLSLNVLECPPGNHTQHFGFGSTTFEVRGVQGEECVFGHGTEIESPDWNGVMTHACSIDTQQAVELTVTDDGINLETFEASCVEI